MKYKIIASCLVIIVSAFSFANGYAQTADHTAGHVTPATIAGLTTNFQTTTVGSTDWKNSMTVPAGTATSWLISYKNDGSVLAPKIILHASLPLNHTLVSGSVMWFDPNFPTGYQLTDAGLFNEGVDIGAVASGSNGYIRFRTTFSSTTPCGIASSAMATIEANNTTAQHTASVSTPACITTTTSVTNTPTTSSSTTTSAVTGTAPQTTHDPSHATASTTTTSSTSSADSSTIVSSVIATTSSVGQTSSTVQTHTAEHNVVQPTPTQTTATVSSLTATPATTSHTQHDATQAVAGASTVKQATAVQPKTVATTTSHEGHDLPKAGGSPFWLMSIALAVGYLFRIIRLRNKIKVAEPIPYV